MKTIGNPFRLYFRFVRSDRAFQIEARESAQKKLNAGYPGDDNFSTRRVKLITDPAVENA